MAYAVGQIIYIVLAGSKPQLVPVLVAEEITKRNLTGETKSYIVQIGDDASKRMPLSDLKAEVFSDADEAQRILLERSTNNIKARVADARKRAKLWYPTATSVGDSEPAALPQQEQLSSPVDDDNSTILVLPDGTQARVRLPSTVMP